MDRFDPIALAVAKAAAGGGGSSLPAVTEADNGKVLTVVNGAWDKAAPSGGSEIFEVVFEVSVGASGIEVIADKTFADVAAANQSGKIIAGRALFWQAYPYRVTLTVQVDTEITDTATFDFDYVEMMATEPTAEDIIFHARISWDSGINRWKFQGGAYTLTPAS